MKSDRNNKEKRLNRLDSECKSRRTGSAPIERAIKGMRALHNESLQQMVVIEGDGFEVSQALQYDWLIVPNLYNLLVIYQSKNNKNVGL